MPDEATTFTDIYSESYALTYNRLYIEHPLWELKRAFNTRAIAALLNPWGSGWTLAAGKVGILPSFLIIGASASTSAMPSSNGQCSETQAFPSFRQTFPTTNFPTDSDSTW